LNTNQQIADAIFEKVFAELIPSSKQSSEETAAQAKMLYEFFRYGTVKSIKEVLESAGNTRSLEYTT
jgi:hypothetical protein